jgi:hypothetical protein
MHPAQRFYLAGLDYWIACRRRYPIVIQGHFVGSCANWNIRQRAGFSSTATTEEVNMKYALVFATVAALA